MGIQNWLSDLTNRLESNEKKTTICACKWCGITHEVTLGGYLKCCKVIIIQGVKILEPIMQLTPMAVLLTTRVFTGLTVSHFTEKLQKENGILGHGQKMCEICDGPVRIFLLSLILCIWNNSKPYPHLQNCSIS